MPELIDRDALIRNYCGACANKDFCAEESCPYYEIRCRIENAPTIEAEPVRKGRWIMLEPYGAHHTHRRKCSECGEIKSKELTNFCPNCGAKMDGGADNG